jgi:hypothetical protein
MVGRVEGTSGSVALVLVTSNILTYGWSMRALCGRSALLNIVLCSCVCVCVRAYVRTYLHKLIHVFITGYTKKFLPLEEEAVYFLTLYFPCISLKCPCYLKNISSSL